MDKNRDRVGPSLHTKLREGAQLHQQGRLAEAEKIYRDILAHDPQSAEALDLLGLAALQSGRDQDALDLTARAIAIDPTIAQAHNTRGAALKNMKRFAEALVHCDAAVALDPDYLTAHINRGYVLANLARHEEALASYNHVIRLRPDFAEAHAIRGNMLTKLDRHDEAVASYKSSLTLNPRNAEVHNNRGTALQALGRIDAARASFTDAIALRGDYADALFHRGITELLLGEFANGWRDYEARKCKKDPVGDRSFPQPLWLGEPSIAGKTILVHWEQGLGDTIQFCRYIDRLEQAGARVIFAPQDSLATLMRSRDGAARIVRIADAPSDIDYHCPLMSLPLAFATDLATIPHRVPYLHADPARVEHWRDRIGPTGFRIGICWQGSPAAIDRGRSFPLAQFAAISRLPDVRLISLQKGPGEDQLAHVPPGMTVETLGADFDSGSDAFADAAAIMQACDLVITPDTSIAHLAGALARPTWIALQKVPDWRWMLTGETTPWYPAAQLFRQEKSGDWTNVFTRMEAALRARTDRGAR